MKSFLKTLAVSTCVLAASSFALPTTNAALARGTTINLASFPGGGAGLTTAVANLLNSQSAASVEALLAAAAGANPAQLAAISRALISSPFAQTASFQNAVASAVVSNTGLANAVAKLAQSVSSTSGSASAKSALVGTLGQSLQQAKQSAESSNNPAAADAIQLAATSNSVISDSFATAQQGTAGTGSNGNGGTEQQQEQEDQQTDNEPTSATSSGSTARSGSLGSTTTSGGGGGGGVVSPN